jgi:hypothetical protein
VAGKFCNINCFRTIPMRVILASALAASLLALLPVGNAQAAVRAESLQAVLQFCPVEAQVGTCVSAVVSFANAREPGTERDRDLVQLVGALWNNAEGLTLPDEVCRELEDSAMMAHRAASSRGARVEIRRLAKSICGTEKVAVFTPSSSIGDGDNPPPGGGNDNPPPGGGGTTPTKPPLVRQVY